jgi:hypothetical protein
MKTKTIFCFLMAFLVLSVNAQERGPVAISPGSENRVAVAGYSCPTFSWSGVEWAAAYTVAVFEAVNGESLSYEEMEAIASPVLTKEIQGRALSWTPSSDERLNNGGMYVWYVQAKDAQSAGIWSEGKTFKVEVETRLVGMKETVRESLKDHGVSDEVIDDVLGDMDSGLKEVVLWGVDVPGSDYTTQDKFGTRGLELSYNTYYGLEAGDNTVGYYDSFFGRSAGYTNTTGDANTFMGYRAGYLNDTGNSNVFIGHRAGYANTSGEYNIIIGANAGFSTSTGSNNTIIGYQAGASNYAGQGNVFLGNRVGPSYTVDNRLFIDNTNRIHPLIYGEFDNDIVAINGKLGVGTQSPGYPMQLATNGTNAAFVIDRQDGATTYFNATGSYGNLGTISNHPVRMAVNSVWRLRLETDNSLTMASGATCTAGGQWVDSSSRKLKENIRSLTVEEAKQALEGLEPVRFNYKADTEEESLGFIAEEVPDLVASKDRKGMSAMDVVAVLTKVVQEQQKRDREQQKIIEELVKEIEALKKKNM